MRILFWCEQYWPYIGGVEVISTRLTRSLVERGHDVTVVTAHGSRELPDEERADGVSIHRFRFFEALHARDLEALAEARAGTARIKRMLDPDVVHVGIVSPSVFFHLQTAAAAPCPTLVSHQGGLPGNAAGPDTLFGRLLRSADHVACCSRAMLDETLELVPELAGRSSVIFNGFAEPALPPAPLPEGAPRLLALGRVVPEKAFDLAIEAMPGILRAFPEARLRIAGDGPERARLMERATALELRGAIEFTGWIEPDDVPALMNGAALVLVPSRVEAFGLVALEAAMMARPVVAARTGGLPEVVLDGVTGRLVDPESPGALASAAVELLRDRAAMIEMGRRGRERALADFTWTAYVDAYEALYRHVGRACARQGPP